MADGAEIILQASVVTIEDRALAIEGPSGSGKSSLALALIDRGAMLIGDDAATLTLSGDNLIASAPPNIAGLIELHGIGLFELPVGKPTALSLILTLGGDPERLPKAPATRTIHGIDIPVLPFNPGTIAPAVRAEWALRRFGTTGPLTK